MASSTERCAPPGIRKWKFKPQWSTIHTPTGLSSIKDRTSFQCWRSSGEVGSLTCCCGTVKWYSHSGIKYLTERMEWKDCGHSHERSAWRLLWWSVLCFDSIHTLSWLWWLCKDLTMLPQGTGHCWVFFPSHSFLFLSSPPLSLLPSFFPSPRQGLSV